MEKIFYNTIINRIDLTHNNSQFYDKIKNRINDLQNNIVKRDKSCIILTHLGLGDNITMIGAIRYLTLYYENIKVICKNHNYNNVKSFYQDDNNITIIPIDTTINEHSEVQKLLSNIDNNIDILISGCCHINSFKNRITNDNLINKINNNKYTFPYQFIIDFYTHINIDFSIYSLFFYINDTENSKKLLKFIEKYKIIFCHTLSSNNKINIDLNDYINDNNYIIICPNKNYYDNNNKYEIVQKYINLSIIDYISIIKSADIIHVIDSAFSCIIQPLQLINELNKF